MYRWFFKYPLRIGPYKEKLYTFNPSNTSYAPIDYYEIDLKNTTRQIWPDRAATKLTAYDGEIPGPIFVMQQGREAVIRFTNHGPYNMSVHVHGQYNRAPFDGWAADYALPGQYKDYYYPNTQNARTAWFHDHTEFTTGENVYRGQGGMYIITDPQEQALKLPKGNYDVPLAIAAKKYNDDGSLLYTTQHNNGLWGDIIEVNGQPWPYFKVEPRKYRFRMVNAAVSRTFSLYLAEDYIEDGKYVVGTDSAGNFHVIGADAGLLSYPVRTPSLDIAMGERYEIVIDFEPWANKNLTMRNQRGAGENKDYAATDMVMRFVVTDTVTDDTNNGALPSVLRYIAPPPDGDLVEKNFIFERKDGNWEINGTGFIDVKNRILTRPDRGADEIWTLINGSGDNDGNEDGKDDGNEDGAEDDDDGDGVKNKDEGGKGQGVHPIHIHLVDFRILSRENERDDAESVVREYESAGMKDVVWLGPGEKVKVLARYAPWNGVYMFHCHNLVHEDHDMMVAFNITNLAQWGYNESTAFIDPLQPEFRPKDIEEAQYTEDAIMGKIQWFFDWNSYNHGDVQAVYDALDSEGLAL